MPFGWTTFIVAVSSGMGMPWESMSLNMSGYSPPLEASMVKLAIPGLFGPTLTIWAEGMTMRSDGVIIPTITSSSTSRRILKDPL